MESPDSWQQNPWAKCKNISISAVYLQRTAIWSAHGLSQHIPFIPRDCAAQNLPSSFSVSPSLWRVSAQNNSPWEAPTYLQHFKSVASMELYLMYSPHLLSIPFSRISYYKTFSCSWSFLLVFWELVPICLIILLNWDEAWSVHKRVKVLLHVLEMLLMQTFLFAAMSLVDLDSVSEYSCKILFASDVSLEIFLVSPNMNLFIWFNF